MEIVGHYILFDKNIFKYRSYYIIWKIFNLKSFCLKVSLSFMLYKNNVLKSLIFFTYFLYLFNLL